jgi:hypothetical protein
MIERRQAPRHRVLKGATIAFEGTSVACTVRNMSSTGVAIDVPDTISLPSSFTLLIHSDGLERRCRPVWSNDRRIGLAFQ